MKRLTLALLVVALASPLMAGETKRFEKTLSWKSDSQKIDIKVDKNVTIEVTDRAKQHLAEKGYDPMNGARPLARVIENEVKKPLGDELLFGRLEFGGNVLVDVKDGVVTFEYTSNDPEPRRQPAREAVN